MFTDVVSLLLLPCTLAAVVPTRRTAVEVGCTILPLEITAFHTVDNSASLHELSFNVTLSATEGAVHTGSCLLDAPNGDLDEQTGACEPQGSAFINYKGNGALSIGVDVLCSPNSGTPQIDAFNGTVPLKCSFAPGARACFQDGEVELERV